MVLGQKHAELESFIRERVRMDLCEEAAVSTRVMHLRNVSCKKDNGKFE